MQNNGASYQFEFQKSLRYLFGESKSLGFLICCFELIIAQNLLPYIAWKEQNDT